METNQIVGIKKEYKYYPKLTAAQVQEVFKNDVWANDFRLGFWNHQSHTYNKSIDFIRKRFAENTKAYLIAKVLNYRCNEGCKKGYVTHAQIAYVAETSVKNVEKVTAILVKAGFYEHCENSESAHLTRKFKQTCISNPFKWIWKFLKKWTNESLKKLKEGFKRIKFVYLIPHANVKSKTPQHQQHPPDREELLVEWSEWDD